MRPFWMCSLVLLLLALPAGNSARAVSVIFDDSGKPEVPPEFFAAAITGDCELIRDYLCVGVSPNAQVPSPAPPQLLTAGKPNALCSLVLREGGATALMLAIAYKQHDAAKALVDAGADKEARTHRGTRPLDLAADLDDVPAMQLLLDVTPASDAAHLTIQVDLETQHAILYRDGVAVLDTHISSGRDEKPTPRGTFVVTQKYEDWHSTLYHNASMPHFLRLSCSAVGLHGGSLPGYRASHGCIRLPQGVAAKLYKIVPRGTVVTIQ